jgi:hypothetical protein
VGQVSKIGLDTAKQVFQAHGADEVGNVVFRKKLARGRVLAFLASQPPCLVALEACGGSHHWAREIAKLGHQVKLIAPKYVKPFIKRQKSDMKRQKSDMAGLHRAPPSDPDDHPAHGSSFFERDEALGERLERQRHADDGAHRPLADPRDDLLVDPLPVCA